MAAVFSGAAISVASVGIENEDGSVFAGDLDRLVRVYLFKKFVTEFTDSLGKSVQEDNLQLRIICSEISSVVVWPAFPL